MTRSISHPKAVPGDVVRISTPEEAREVSAFLLSPGLFGTPLTPGEEEEFATRPAATLGRPDDGYWVIRDGEGTPEAVIGIRMNAERTGIYEISALAVRPGCRGRGTGRRLLEFAMRRVTEAGGRGLLFETSSDASYRPMHRLLGELGFERVGRFPDFYFPGEDTLWYFQKMNCSPDPE